MLVFYSKTNEMHRRTKFWNTKSSKNAFDLSASWLPIAIDYNILAPGQWINWQKDPKSGENIGYTCYKHWTAHSYGVSFPQATNPTCACQLISE